MRQKTFFTIAAIVFLAMVAFFAIQLSGMGKIECHPFFNWECDIVAQTFCGSDDYTNHFNYSFCDNTTCVGSFTIFCMDTPDKRDSMYCSEDNHIYCASEGW